MNCEICGINCGSYNGVIYSGVLSGGRNFQREFRAKKELEQKDDNDKFEFCRKCDKEFRKYYAETLIGGELNQKNFVEVGLYSFCCEESFDSKNNWQKFQKALTENIQRHYQEWRIIKAKILGSQKKERYLVHQSARMEYERGLLKFEPKKMWPIRRLPIDWEQWKNLEKQIVSNSPEQEIDPFPTKQILIVASLILVIVILLFISRKKKNKKNNIWV